MRKDYLKYEKNWIVGNGVFKQHCIYCEGKLVESLHYLEYGKQGPMCEACLKMELFELPIKLPDEDSVYDLFAGRYIGIVNGMIIATDPSLSGLRTRAEKVMAEDQECDIEYIENESKIYTI